MIEVKAKAVRSSPICAASKRAKVSPAFLALEAGSIRVSERRWASVSICAAVRALVFMVAILRALVMWAEGAKIVAAFTPRMGRRYANGRNTDHGPGAHKAVSVLSPYVRRRLVTEQQLVATAIDAHGPEDAEKFVQEVIWCGYFKGWLERRPQVWASYHTGLNADLTALDRDRRLRRDVERAMSGQTGLACFDAWAADLADTGYLHNHARMRGKMTVFLN